jgi:hypothetical protein
MGLGNRSRSKKVAGDIEEAEEEGEEESQVICFMRDPSLPILY